MSMTIAELDAEIAALQAKRADLIAGLAKNAPAKPGDYIRWTRHGITYRSVVEEVRSDARGWTLSVRIINQNNMLGPMRLVRAADNPEVELDDIPATT
jgi:hypothetical protein